MKSYIKNKLAFLKKELSLKELIQKEKKADKEINKILQQNHSPLWIPSIRSFLVIFSFVLILGTLSHPIFIKDFILVPTYKLFFNFFGDYQQFNNFVVNLKEFLNCIKFIFTPIIRDTDSHYQNLIAIHSGIGAVLVGLAFFVAQSLIDKNDPDKGRVLLYKSYFFPLLTAEVLTYFIFLWGDINVFSILTLVILGFFTIYFLGSTINILLQDFEMEKAKKQMFFSLIKRRFLNILDYSFDKKIGDKILLEKEKIIKNDSGGLILLSRPYINEENYEQIYINKNGYVSDISFLNLNKLVNEFKKHINPNTMTSNNIDITSDFQIDDPVPLVYIVPLFQEKITGATVFVHKSLEVDTKDSFMTKIKNLTSKTYITSNQFPQNEKEARLEISKLKDRCIHSITHEQSGELEKIIGLYIGLVNEFYSYIKPYGGKYSRQQAENERSFSFFSINPINWLSRDIREVFEKGMQSDNSRIVTKMAYLPIKIAHEAIEHNDHYLFQEFINFPMLTYLNAFERKKQNPRIANLLFDRSSRYLTEMFSFYLSRNEELNDEDIINYSVYILRTFQSLIKLSFDNDDLHNYKNYITKMKSLFRQYSYTTKKREVFTQLNNYRNQVLFGISGWTLYKLLPKKHHNKDFHNYIIDFLPKDIISFTQLYIDTSLHRTEERWGWDNWELSEKEEGKAHMIDFSSKLMKLYVVHSLNILKNSSNGPTLPHSREFAFQCRENGDMLKLLDEIKNGANNFVHVLNKNAINNIDSFKDLLKQVVASQAKEELETKIKTRISSVEVESFKKSVVKNYNKSSGIRNIFEYYNLYKNNIDRKLTTYSDRRGINIFFDKAAFFDKSIKWDTDFVDKKNGFNFGRTVANGDSYVITSQLIKILPEISFNLKKIKKKINKKNDFDIPIMVCINCYPEDFLETNSYIEKWKLSKTNQYPDEFSGYYNVNNIQVPTFKLYTQHKEKIVFYLDAKNLGGFVHLNPLDQGESNDLKEQMLYIDIFELMDNSNIMKDYLRDPPDWLSKNEDIRSFLLSHVVIKIFSRVVYSAPKKQKGFYVKIK